MQMHPLFQRIEATTDRKSEAITHTASVLLEVVCDISAWKKSPACKGRVLSILLGVVRAFHRCVCEWVAGGGTGFEVRGSFVRAKTSRRMAGKRPTLWACRLCPS